MARRIRRRRRVSQAVPQPPAQEVRSSTRLPEAKAMPATRVMITAPGPLRTVLMSRLSGSDQVELAGVAQDELGAVEKMVKEGSDVAAIFMHLGGPLEGLEIARNVNRACPHAGILILTDDLSGTDVRRNARLFGTGWSYMLADNAEKEQNFSAVVQSVGRGLHWIDSAIRDELEMAWKTAEEARDLDVESGMQQLGMSQRNPGAPPIEPPSSSGSGIQTARIGNGGIGSNFGVRKAG